MDCEWARWHRWIGAYDPRSCENNVLFRGHFNGTGSETSVNLTIYGGSGKSLRISLPLCDCHR